MRWIIRFCFETKPASRNCRKLKNACINKSYNGVALAMSISAHKGLVAANSAYTSLAVDWAIGTRAVALYTCGTDKQSLAAGRHEVSTELAIAYPLTPFFLLLSLVRTRLYTPACLTLQSSIQDPQPGVDMQQGELDAVILPDEDGFKAVYFTFRANAIRTRNASHGCNEES